MLPNHGFNYISSIRKIGIRWVCFVTFNPIWPPFSRTNFSAFFNCLMYEVNIVLIEVDYPMEWKFNVCLRILKRKIFSTHWEFSTQILGSCDSFLPLSATSNAVEGPKVKLLWDKSFWERENNMLCDNSKF